LMKAENPKRINRCFIFSCFSFLVGLGLTSLQPFTSIFV
jgi:hypothetical protein